MAEPKALAFISLAGIQEQTGWSRPRIYEMAGRAYDPLPLRYLKGSTRGGVALVDELADWYRRNTVMFNEREQD